jgi:vacuolar-type H+-ATPase subunit I/STV1
MSEELNVGILLDTSEAQKQLNEINTAVKQTNGNLDITKQEARDTLNMAMSAIRGTYSILRGVLKSAGISIDAVTNAVIQASMMAGQQLITLATAQSVTPGMQAAAVISFIQAGVIIAMAVQQEKEAKDISREIESAQSIVSGVNSIIGGINW